MLLFVSNLFYLECLGKAVFCDCGLSLVTKTQICTCLCFMILDYPEPMTAQDKRELAFQRSEWRRILPELSVPLRNTEAEDEEIFMLRDGRPEPFIHPEDIPSHNPHQPKKPRIPNLWPFR